MVPRSGGHDGALALHQPVEQARLADVGTPYDGQRQPLVHNLAVGEAFGQAGQRLADLGHPRQYLLARNHCDIVFGKVYAGFHQGNQLDQLLLDRLQAVRKSAFQLPGGDPGLVERLRLDQVAHRLGLRQVDTAVQEGAHGELAGLGQPGATGQSELDHPPQHYRRAVAGNLDYIVGGVGMRLGEVGDDHLVEALARFRLDQHAEACPSGLELAPLIQPQHGRCDRCRLRSRKPHHAQAAASGRGSDGHDGIVKVHGLIVAKRPFFVLSS